MRIVAVAVALALVAAACGGDDPAATTRPIPASVPPLPEATPAPRAFDERRPIPCDETPPKRFSLLCQTYDLVVHHYYRPVEPAALAAAALAGVATVDLVAAEPPEASAEPFVCALPDPSFDVVCAEIADRARAGASVPDLVEAAVSGIFRFGLDPFSTYVPPAATELIDPAAPGRVASLGVIVATRAEDGAACAVVGERCHLEIVAVDDFTPAAAAGLGVGDVIDRIDGVSVNGLTLIESVTFLDGPAGSMVRLGISRSGLSLTKTLVRDYVPTAYVEWDLVDGIGWVHLADFSQTAAQALGKVLSGELAGIDRLVLDLRGNPGGLLPAAQAVLSQFLDDGTAFVLQQADDTVPMPVLQGGLATDVTLVVLVDRGTASAAELVAAALQESGRAVVLGERTFGKEAVQEIFPLRNRGEARISVATWTTAKGRSVGVNGLVPDVPVDPDPAGAVDVAFEEAIRRLGG